MRKFVLAVGLVLMASSAQAASYQQTDGTIVDPIQSLLGGNHPYDGIDLIPAANPRGENLDYADLYRIDLDGSDLLGASMIGADVSNADLNSTRLEGVNFDGANLAGTSFIFSNMYQANFASANLTDANLRGAIFNLVALNGADLSGANLSEARYLGRTTGIPYYDAFTDFTQAWDTSIGHIVFDPIAAGWILIPEPSTAIMVGMGLVGLAGMGRRSALTQSRRPHRGELHFDG